ncbi:MAG: sugar phosphate isomerase/epimerase [Lentisphaerae bacterium]|jgi:sugar phosphate isomerase/epimerase|nr:sugar phosphate isomerase/epimerase [Lentisphaerota bacterium]
MTYIPVGLEMYSVRKEFAASPYATMKAVKAMGYEGVEFAGAPVWGADFYAALLKETDLVCCGWHTPWESLQPEKIADTIRLNLAVGNKYVIVPGIAANTHAEWLEKAIAMNDIADQLAVYGLRCGYHNHSKDFALLDGKTTWDTFMSNTSDRVVMQLDTGNALAGNANIMQTLNDYPGRCQTIHLKPYSRAKGYEPLIGEDDCPWKDIFAFCQTKGNTEWYIIEYECPAYPALEAVEKCLVATRKLLE